MLHSQSGKGCLIAVLVILLLVLGVVWYFPGLMDSSLEETKQEDIYIQLSTDGTGSRLGAKQGYGVILDCEGKILSPPSPGGVYEIKIMVEDEVVYQDKINANQKFKYKIKTRLGTGMTFYSHEIKGLSGQKDGVVTYNFKYTYSYKSILDRLVSFDF